MTDIVKLDGRQFHGVRQSLTAAQDDYLLGHLRRAGALETLADDALSDEQRAERMLTEIMVSGETFPVLAGCLTEEGKSWSREQAQQNARRFASITDPDEKLAMRGQLVGLVLGFFWSARRSSEISRRSSSQNGEAPDIESADPPTSDSSLPPSGTSQAATQAASPT